MFINKYLKYIILIIIAPLFIYSSCSPIIRNFDITDKAGDSIRTATSDDSLILRWKVCGKPAILFHEVIIADSLDKHTIDYFAKYLEFTLIATKCKKEARLIIQIAKLPKESIDSIIFKTSFNKSNDTLIATGIKSPQKWGNKFKIMTVTSASNRELIISHDGKVIKVNETAPSNELFGSPVEGTWEFKSPVSEAEKQNPSLLPEFLKIRTTIQYKKSN